MPCVNCGSVLLKAAAIVLLGAAIGAADAFVLRPITLVRQTPPPITVAPAGSTPSPAPHTAAPTESAPAPQPNTAVGSPAQAFEFTPKDRLPAGQITVDEAKALFEQGATFIDSRKPDKYELGHVKGSFRIELASFDRGDPPILAAIARDGIIVVYCSGGHCDESEAVARMLDGSGYKRVYVMHDGFPGWVAKGLPTETGKGIE